MTFLSLIMSQAIYHLILISIMNLLARYNIQG